MAQPESLPSSSDAPAAAGKTVPPAADAASPSPAPASSDHGHGHGNGNLFGLTLGSIGVVYGDIGTSPLYAFREALIAAVGAHNTTGATVQAVPRETVLGVLSLIVWSLLLVVTVKYVLILLRADNNGEGGTLSLMALAQRVLGRGRVYIVAGGIIGASMFYGDSVITPAISVLSAVEGLKLVAPGFEHYVVPVTVCILVVLFAVQSRGTAKVAAFFGPVMAAWFLLLALGGLMHVSDDPGVVLALNPVHGIAFVIEHKMIGLVTLGAVFLAVTGGEALLRRPRPFRPPSHPDRLARARAALARDQLFRPGRAHPLAPRPHRQPVLPALSRLGPHPVSSPWRPRPPSSPARR